MRKRFKKIIKVLVSFLGFLLAVMVILFYFYPSLLVDFYIGADERSIWAKTSPITFNWKILDTLSNVDDLQWSPDEKHLVYTDFAREVLYEKEYFIKVIDVRALKVSTVFIGPWEMGYFKWIDNNTIRVYVGGASGSRAYHDTDIHIKKPFVAVDHQEGNHESDWGFEAWWEYDDLDEWSDY